MNSQLRDVIEIQKKKLHQAARLSWFHWVILATSLVLTVSTWYFLEVQNQLKNRQEFETEAQRAIDLLTDRMQKYEVALIAGVAAIQALDYQLTRKKWHQFSSTLNIDERYPAINGIGVIYQVSPLALSEYLANARKDYPEFKVHPKHNNNDYWPITFIEPLEINRSVLGVDMAHENNRYQAALLAKSSGTSQITAPITLVQELRETAGFLFYMPYFSQPGVKAHAEKPSLFKGLVYAPVIASTLISSVLDQTNRQVSIRIRDQNNNLFDEFKKSNLDYGSNPSFTQKFSVDFYGRVWDFEIWSNHLFDDSRGFNQSWLVLVSGLLINLLLFFLLSFFTRSNHKTHDVADSTYDANKLKNFYISSIVDNVNEGLITIDHRGFIQTTNRACEKIFGYKEEEMIGQNVKLLMPPDIAENHDQYLETYRRKGVKNIIGVGQELVAQTKCGQLIPIDLSVSEIKIDSQVVFSGVIRDLSDKQKYEDNMLNVLKFQELVMESIPDFMFVKDKDFKIIQANNAFLSLYPDSMKGKIIGYTTLETYKEDERKEFLKYDQIAFDKGLSEVEETIQFPDGKVRVLLTKKQRFQDPDGEVFILGLARDITDLTESKEKLLSSNKQLDDFAYIASHDLKEPLRGIYNHSSFLMEDYEAILDKDGKHKINRIIYLAKRMENLISDLLYYSRLGRVELAVVDVDLNELVDDIFDMAADDETLQLQCLDRLPTIRCDRIRIGEVFRNLVTNAIKYNNSEQKIIEVGVYSDWMEERGHRYIFYVRDNGIGIEKKFHTEIFRIFKRLHRVDAYGGGTGSGLTFVQKIVEAHDGEVWLKSSGENGTTFYFSLLSDL